MDTPTTTAIALRSDVALTFEELFDPIEAPTVATLLAEYRAELERVERVASIFADEELLPAVQHFMDGASDRHHHTPSPAAIFKLGPAVAVLNAAYWQRVLATTDVYEAMPEPRREAWNKSISERKTPGFDESTVFATLGRLLADRKTFFAEKVDGVFRALSGDHKTNLPTGFSKRMILQGVYDGYGSSRRCGYVSDLREVIAKFMARDVPPHLSTWAIVKGAREGCCGEWVTVDGGALRIRVYKNGNGHLEVHPEMAWRLNCVLASIYPNAIASELRTRPRKQPKGWRLFGRPLPFVVLGLLQGGSIDDPCTTAQAMDRLRRQDRYLSPGEATPERLADAAHEGRWRWTNYIDKDDTHARAEACRVLEALGATRVRPVGNYHAYEFTYNPRAVIREVIASGCIPDQRAHQYYPTPRLLAERVVALAEIGEGHTVLEPSAGQGAIAELLPPERTTCIEVAKLHCEVLRAKGIGRVIEADFLGCSHDSLFDRVVMNPPFDDGRWLARLVAVLPSGAAGKNVLPGWSCTWSESIPFQGTSIEVVILVAERASR